MTLRAVPKPEGFELREARAAKTDDASAWLPADAIYDACEQMKVEPPAVAALVAWYTRLPSGKLALKYRCYYEYDRQAVALASDLLTDLHG